jgi:tetratricopeptide (TPR) repeat protein
LKTVVIGESSGASKEAIMAVMAIYQERDDQHGLGNANREYGDLLRSRAILKWETVYRRDGFQDKSITFDNRREKASEFYRKALTHYEKAATQKRESEEFGALTNVYFNMAWSHYMLNERDRACASYDRAVEAYNENIAANPSAKPYIPPGSGSFAEFIGSHKRRVGCQ